MPKLQKIEEKMDSPTSQTQLKIVLECNHSIDGVDF